MFMAEEVKLDLKDKRLITELDFNARATYNELGKKIGLSKQGVEYKLNVLMEKKVILGFYPVINVPKLGYNYFRFAFSFRNVTEKIEDEIIEYLKAQKEIFWIFTFQGVYDVGFAVWSKSILEFQKTINKLMSKYGKYVKNKNESIPTDVIHYQNRFLLKEPRTKEIHIQETLVKSQIDDIDKKILKELCENARKPLVEIANTIDSSAKVVSYRVKKLEKEKIIEGYRPIINYSILGYTYYKLWVSINYESLKEINKLYDYIKCNTSVIYVVKGIGFPEDLDFEIVVKDNAELYELIKDLKQKFPAVIGDYKILMSIDMKKVRYLPF